MLQQLGSKRFEVPARNAGPGRDVCPRTKLVLPYGLHPLQVSRRQEGSLLLKQGRPDLFLGNHLVRRGPGRPKSPRVAAMFSGYR